MSCCVDCALSSDVTDALRASPGATDGRFATESERFSPFMYGDPLHDRGGGGVSEICPRIGRYARSGRKKNARSQLHQDGSVLLRQRIRIGTRVCKRTVRVYLIALSRPLNQGGDEQRFFWISARWVGEGGRGLSDFAASSDNVSMSQEETTGAVRGNCQVHKRRVRTSFAPTYRRSHGRSSLSGFPSSRYGW